MNYEPPLWLVCLNALAAWLNFFIYFLNRSKGNLISGIVSFVLFLFLLWLS